MNIENYVFMGMNGSVCAVNRDSGQIIWHWQSPKPRRGFVSVFLDEDRLMAGLSGYLYCLEAASGRVLWENPLKGFGYGNFSFASVRGQGDLYAAVQEEQDEEARRAQQSAATTHTS
jgi:outer membrane protein assembly factor BamB